MIFKIGLGTSGKRKIFEMSISLTPCHLLN